MPPKTIGIVGGAGPLAGILLVNKIVRILQTEYGCSHDADFPLIHLMSFPFSDMLSEKSDPYKVKCELRTCLYSLKDRGASVLAIACNTLHAFLEEDEYSNVELIHIIKCVKTKLSDDLPLVLCTSQSRSLMLHKKFIDCLYPDNATQQQVDEVIQLSLQGKEKVAGSILNLILYKQTASTILLGCTELSLLTPYLISNKFILDGLEIVAQNIVKTSFNERRIYVSNS